MLRWRSLLPLVLVGLLALAPPAYLADSAPAGDDSLAAGSGPEVILAAVGDLNLGGGLGERILSKGPDYPWAGTNSVLALADLRLANLEVMLSLKGRVYTPKKYTLRADPRTIGALVSGGFEVVSLGNNHAMDFGPAALLETIAILDQHGIAHAGAGANLAAARAPALAEVHGLRLAFLSYSLTYPTEFYAGQNKPGTAPGYENYLRADLAAAKKLADLVVVSFHWSEERLNFPKDYQRRLGRLAVDLGAAVVIGHHPHVLQGFEAYHGGLIAYSLGNFAFGSYSAKAADSAILLVGLDRRGPHTAWIYPCNVNNYEVAFQTRLRTGADAARVLNDLRRYSAPFGTTIVPDGDRGIITIRPGRPEPGSGHQMG